MEHSPGGKAYLLAMGAPSPETINKLEAYEFFAGHDEKGKPIWTNNFKQIKPLLSWNNNMGCAAATLCARAEKTHDVRVRWLAHRHENEVLRLGSRRDHGAVEDGAYMKDFGEQAYFLNFPSKFISEDGRTLWLCYAANFRQNWNGVKLNANPPGSRYGLCLQEVKLLGPAEPKK